VVNMEAIIIYAFALILGTLAGRYIASEFIRLGGKICTPPCPHYIKVKAYVMCIFSMNAH